MSVLNIRRMREAPGYRPKRLVLVGDHLELAESSVPTSPPPWWTEAFELLLVVLDSAEEGTSRWKPMFEEIKQIVFVKRPRLPGPDDYHPSKAYSPWPPSWEQGFEFDKFADSSGVNQYRLLASRNLAWALWKSIQPLTPDGSETASSYSAFDETDAKNSQIESMLGCQNAIGHVASTAKTRPRRANEHSGGPSGYTTAFTHPDPMDPNDRVRQKTQSRIGDYPYDRSISYGSPQGTDLGGGAYQRPPDLHPPASRMKRPGDVIPYGQRGTAWEQLEDLTAPYEPGSQSDDAAYLGYGNMGLMGDGGLDPDELDMDALRDEFRCSFVDTLPQAQALGKTGLFSLLVQLDPEYSAELFGPEDDGEMADIYTDWGRHVYAPGAEHDEETPPDEDYPE